ncbi:MAG: nicotinate-nucleotide--dimethylbenzimidazole phosphoribosyltransferase [Gammaproteobacteria bacterium]|nr:nicotinate-nucleotide--dimethylbenzimidazole phosphoribosyltransferase [Gammaproteobacteria bacterium]
MFSITPVSTSHITAIKHQIDTKTKPLGALGKLEDLAQQLVQILGPHQTEINQPTQLVFAGDHGIAEFGVSIADSEVTGQMVANFCAGGAAINVFCRQANMNLVVIDCGTTNEQPNHSRLVKQRLGEATEPFNLSPAMYEQDAVLGIKLGAKIAQQYLDQGSNLIGIGEMGIANTTSAAAMMMALTALDLEYCVGRGTGVDDDSLARKKQIIETAMLLHSDILTSPLAILAALGGYEIAQMVGAMLATAQAKQIILVDGFITSTAALLAMRMYPAARGYMVFSHCSKELGHHLLLKELQGEPLLNLDLRLGEGSGCPLALPLIQSALAFYHQMASFEQAKVTEVN